MVLTLESNKSSNITSITNVRKKKPLTKKQKSVMKEKMQAKRAALTPEQQATENALRRAKHAALTPEQQATENALRRAKHAALTPEQKATENALRRAKHAALTPEQKATENAKRRAKRDALTPEQKATAKRYENAKRRAKCAALTPEQKATENAKRRSKHAENMKKPGPSIKLQERQQKQKMREKHAEAKISQRANFNMTSLPEDTSPLFYEFENCPEASALLYHLNSGHEEFNKTDSFLEEALHSDSSVLDEIKLDEIRKEIFDQILSDEELAVLLQKYVCYQGRSMKNQIHHCQGLPDSVDPHQLVCGMCGIRCIQGRYGKSCSIIALEDLPEMIQFSEEELHEHEEMKNIEPLEIPIDSIGNTRHVELHKLKSCYESFILGKTFHLHPEFVHLGEVEICPVTSQTHAKEHTVLCHGCKNWVDSQKKFDSNDDDSIADSCSTIEMDDDESECTDGDETKTKIQKKNFPPDTSIAHGMDFGNAS
jgi:chemotaxis protein histidine kinase CheA